MSATCQPTGDVWYLVPTDTVCVVKGHRSEFTPWKTLRPHVFGQWAWRHRGWLYFRVPERQQTYGFPEQTVEVIT